MTNQRIVIVGGGYAGTALARSLDAHAEICLIEQREKFTHTFPMLRAVTDPDWAQRLSVPYKHLLQRGKVIHDRVNAVEERQVLLSAGSSLEADWIIVATGSNYASPFKPEGHSLEAFYASNRRAHEQLLDADSVAIVGAGASGIELAGEVAHCFPQKHITLVSSAPSLLPSHPRRLGKTIEKQLAKMGVHCLLKQRASGLQSTLAPSSGILQIGAGKTLEADLIFPAMGARPDNAVFDTMPGVEMNAQKRVTVDPWLRPAGMQSLFCLGDVAATGDNMTALAITVKQAPWLATTLKQALAGKSVNETSPYRAFKTPPVSVALGPENGVGFLPLLSRGVVLGKRLVVAAKSGDFMMDGIYKDFGHKPE